MLDYSINKYIEDIAGMRTLRHPLGYEMPLGIDTAKWIEDRVKLVESVIFNRDWKQYITLHERPHRLHAFLEIGDDLKDDEYWDLLAQVWVDAEKPSGNLSVWKNLFQRDKPNRHNLMTVEEQAILKDLPDEVEIFRGVAQLSYSKGISWTLNREKAVWFAERWLGNGKGHVLSRRIPKSSIVAYFGFRNEQEIIWLDEV